MNTNRGQTPETEPAGLAQRLVRAVTPAQVAQALLEHDSNLAAKGCHALWSSQWPEEIAVYPAAGDSVQARSEARELFDDIRAGMTLPANAMVLSDDGDAAFALLRCPPSIGGVDAEVLSLSAARMSEVLAMQRLRSAVEQLAQSEQVQRALFAIADLAGSDLDMPDMLRGLHRIVSDLMYAENFYIVLYNREHDSFNFVYFVDTVDKEGPPPEDLPASRFEHGPTWYLIHDAKPLMGSGEELRAQVSGQYRMRGADSIDWLGVPMLREGRAEGALIVQSYLPDQQYRTKDMALLAFVAEHVLNAIERKRRHAELEWRVAERTQALASANVELEREVAERERGERLQAALYQIAALAGTDESSERFFQHVHAIVGRLINAQNFYIALLSEDGANIEFVYSVDEYEDRPMPRALGNGLTEQVLRKGVPLIVDSDTATRMAESGEVAPEFLAAPTCSWLGVPLSGADAPIGAVVVQSYRPDIIYDSQDSELLTFVAYQLSSSIQRRRAAAALQEANQDLEARVEVRTRELREQIGVREKVEAQLKHEVMHDALTGLPNRIYLRDRVERCIAHLRRDRGKQFGLLYIDVDRFKLINDSLGHLAGDEFLKEIALRLAQCVREPDVVARLSGDEFALLVEDVSIPETAIKIAQRVQSSMQRPIQVAGRELQASVSIGIALGDQRYDTTDAVLRDADIALYRAKDAGRQRFVAFDENAQDTAMDVLDLEQQLREAIDNDEFEAYFQPLVHLADEEVVGYEALLRWRHPQRGLLAPADFLTVAEEYGLIEQIDWLIFRRACLEAQQLLGEHRFLTLNVSQRHFQDDRFDQRLLALAEETGIPPRQLRIEVTEGALLGDPQLVAAVLGRLRLACVEAALDDFGTGYSSLGHLHRFPLKMLKIDRSFVDTLGGVADPRGKAVVASILALARSVGLEVVAEGIESVSQREALLALGCELGQGYLLGRPHPVQHWQEARAETGHPGSGLA